MAMGLDHLQAQIVKTNFVASTNWAAFTEKVCGKVILVKVPVETGSPSTINQPSYTKSFPKFSKPISCNIRSADAIALSSSLLQERS